MDKSQLDSFFRKTCSADERYEIIHWMLNPVNDLSLKAWMKNHWDFFSSEEGSETPDLERIWVNLQVSLRQEMAEVETPRSIRFFYWKALGWAVAACVVGILIIFGIKPMSSNNQVAQHINAKNLISAINTDASDTSIVLEDGTVVMLKPHSALHYPDHFTNEKREVYLDGEAFFEVTKNPRRPFFVYHKNIITHVLGTSFNVKANDEKGELEVKVRTGRVEVYEANKTKVRNNGVVLTPNQKVIYYQDSRKFETSVTDLPLPLYSDSVKMKVSENLFFNSKTLPEVVAVLQKEYGIVILLENENLNNCLFTGDLKGESLYDLLDIICKSLSAEYEIKGTTILIKGKGCA